MTSALAASTDSPVADPTRTSSASAFERLRRLLYGRKPPAGRQCDLLHLGEISFAPPVDLLRPLAHIEDWCRYPPLGGTAELRSAYRGWLARRFGVTRSVRDGELMLEPTPGSKQSLSALIALATARARARGVERPAVVLPNPFYPTYLAATQAARAEPVYYSVQRGHVGEAVAAAVARAARRVAAVVLCHPGSPDGDMVEEADQVMVAETSASVGATLIVDECYLDVFATKQPTSILSLCDSRLVDPSNLIVLHTLSKRSGTPGLRSGFAIGGPDVVTAYASHNRGCGVSSSLPVCAAAAALWADECHVRRLRDVIARNWDLADTHLTGISGYRRAQSGFFLWLGVTDDEAVACRLWCRHGLMTMPGRYLGASDERGINPGMNRLRVALIQEPERMADSLDRLRTELTQKRLNTPECRSY